MDVNEIVCQLLIAAIKDSGDVSEALGEALESQFEDTIATAASRAVDDALQELPDLRDLELRLEDVEGKANDFENAAGDIEQLQESVETLQSQAENLQSQLKEFQALQEFLPMLQLLQGIIKPKTT